MPIGFNPTTGEAVFWDGKAWAPTQTATNPKTGERVAWDGFSWEKINVPEQPSGLGAALSSGTDILQNNLYSALEGGAKSIGMDELAKWAGEGAARNKEEAAAALPNPQSFSEAQSLGDYWTAAKEALGTSLPSMAPMATGAALGATIGSAVPVIGTGLGGIIGGTLGGIPMFFGSNREAQKDANQGVVKSEGAAILSAMPQALMDSLLPLVLPEFGIAVAGNLLTRVVKKGAEGILEEVPTEIGQQILERYQAGKPIADEDAIREYKEVAIAAGLLGGGIGSVGGALQKPVVPAPPAPQTPADLAEHIANVRANMPGGGSAASNLPTGTPPGLPSPAAPAGLLPPPSDFPDEGPPALGSPNPTPPIMPPSSGGTTLTYQPQADVSQFSPQSQPDLIEQLAQPEPPAKTENAKDLAEQPVLNPEVNGKGRLHPINYGGFKYDDKTQKYVRLSGVSNVVNYQNRHIVIMDVNGQKVPFYVSTGLGGKKLATGKWYPFFGIGEDGWINKTNAKDMEVYYGSPALKNAAEWLDANLGDTRKNQNIPQTGLKGEFQNTLREALGFAGLEYGSESIPQLHKNISDVIKKVDAPAKPVVEAEPTGLSEILDKLLENEDPKTAEAPAEEKRTMKEILDHIQEHVLNEGNVTPQETSNFEAQPQPQTAPETVPSTTEPAMAPEASPQAVSPQVSAPQVSAPQESAPQETATQQGPYDEFAKTKNAQIVMDALGRLNLSPGEKIDIGKLLDQVNSIRRQMDVTEETRKSLKRSLDDLSKSKNQPVTTKGSYEFRQFFAAGEKAVPEQEAAPQKTPANERNAEIESDIAKTLLNMGLDGSVSKGGAKYTNKINVPFLLKNYNEKARHQLTPKEIKQSLAKMASENHPAVGEHGSGDGYAAKPGIRKFVEGANAPEAKPEAKATPAQQAGERPTVVSIDRGKGKHADPFGLSEGTVVNLSDGTSVMVFRQPHYSRGDKMAPTSNWEVRFKLKDFGYNTTHLGMAGNHINSVLDRIIDVAQDAKRFGKPPYSWLGVKVETSKNIKLPKGVLQIETYQYRDKDKKYLVTMDDGTIVEINKLAADGQWTGHLVQRQVDNGNDLNSPIMKLGDGDLEEVLPRLEVGIEAARLYSSTSLPDEIVYGENFGPNMVQADKGPFTAENVVNNEVPEKGTPPQNTLIFMTCGQEKQEGGYFKAIELYTGPFFKTLRANLPKEGPRPKVIILSAKHGIISSNAHVEPYERRLDAGKIDELIGNNRRITESARRTAGVFDDVSDRGQSFSDIKNILLVGGADYQRVMKEIIARLKNEGTIDADVGVMATKGDQGYQLQQLKNYIQTVTGQKATPADEAAAPKHKDPVQYDETTVKIPGGGSVDVQYEIVELNSLEQAKGKLQNRDRSRSAYDAVLANMYSKFDPEQLGEDNFTDRGAPIVGDDNVIDSGNGRAILLGRVYDGKDDAAVARQNAYKDYLKKNGYDLKGFDRPVLIRRRTTEFSPEERRAFVVASNKDVKSGLSTTERSKTDADALTPSVMELYKGKGINSTANRKFVEEFLKNIPANERGNFTTKGLELSADGARRIRSAVKALAYDDVELLNTLDETIDSDDIVSIGAALEDVAGRWVQLRERIRAGEVRPDFDVTEQLVEAAKILRDIRRDPNANLKSYLEQQDMFSPKDPVVIAFLKMFHAPDTKANGEYKPASKNSIIDGLNKFVNRSLEQNTAPDLLGDVGTTTPDELINDINAERVNKNDQGNMFASVMAAELPKKLKGAKPRYGFGKKNFPLSFESDFGKALYIAYRKQNPYREWLVSQGVADKDIDLMGKDQRDNIKSVAKELPSGQALNVPDSYSEAPPAGAPKAAPKPKKGANAPKESLEEEIAPTSGKRQAETAKQQAETDQQQEARPIDPERLKQSRAVVKKFLQDMIDRGDKNAAMSALKAIKDRGLSDTEVHHYLLAMDIASRMLGPTKINPVYMFTNKTIHHPQAGKAAAFAVPPGKSKKFMEGLVAFSLEPGPRKMIEMNAFHEAFHILQGMMEAHDPKTAKIISNAFRSGMTLDDVDPSIKRTLQNATYSNGSSYWDFFKGEYDTMPNLRSEFAKDYEASAYMFGLLADAKRNGQNMNALMPAFKRFVNFIDQFKQRMGNALRGLGYRSAEDVFNDYIAGRQQRGYELKGATAIGGKRASLLGAEADATEIEKRNVHALESGASPVFKGKIRLLHGSENPNKKGFAKNYTGNRYEDGEGEFGSDNVVYLDNTGKWTGGEYRGFSSQNVYEIEANFKNAYVISPETLDDLFSILPDRTKEAEHLREIWRKYNEQPDGPNSKDPQDIDPAFESLQSKIIRPEDIAKVLRKMGHDGIIVQGFDEFTEDYQSRNRSGKTPIDRAVNRGIFETTFQDQVVSLNPENVKVVRRIDDYHKNRKAYAKAVKAPISRASILMDDEGAHAPEIREGVATVMQGANTAARSAVGNWQKVKNVAKSVFDPLAKLPNSIDYLIMRYRLVGRIDELEREAKGFHDTMKKANKEQSAAIFEYLTTRGAAVPNLPNELRDVAVRVKQRIREIGQELSDPAIGILSPQSVALYEDQYLPRLYMKYLLEEKGLISTGPRMGLMQYANKRTNVDEETKVALGEVQDPSFASFAALYRPQRDMAVMKFLKGIAEASDKDWVYPNQLIEWKGTNVTAFWLADEANNIRERMLFEPDAAKKATMANVADRMQRLAAEHVGDIPSEGYKRLPRSNRYGALKGLAVREEIYNDLISMSGFDPDPNFIDRIFGDKNSALSKGTQFWKMSKTILNPPAQIRNFISNAVMLNLSGVPLHRVPRRMLQAMDAIKNDSEIWKKAKEYGIQGGGFNEHELREATNILREYLAENTTGIMNPKKLMNVLAKVTGKAGDWYQYSEQVFKLAKIIDEVESKGIARMPNGAAKERAYAEAALQGHKWFFDYSLVHRGVKSLRSMPFGAPFITYYYKALPLLAEVAMNPKTAMRFAPYVALMAAMPAMVASMYDVDDDDVKKLKMSLSDKLREKPNMIIFPFKDQNNNWQFLDWGYFFPWSMFVDTGTQLAKGDFGAALGTVGALTSPALSVASAIKTNIDPFTGREIINEYDPPKEKMMALLSYVNSLIMPPIATSYGAFGKAIESATNSGVNRYGEPNMDAIQITARAFGFNFYPVVPELQRARNIRRMDYEIQMVRSNLTHNMKDRSLTPEERAALRDDFNAELRRRREARNQYVQDSAIPPELSNRTR